MIHGNKNSKLSEGTQKLPEKNIPQKFHPKSKTLPENTKFTLQYNTVNGHSVKNTDEKGVRSLTPEQSRIYRNLRQNLTVPRGQDGRGKPNKYQNPIQVDSKGHQVIDVQNISAYPGTTTLTMGTDSKPSVTETRRLSKIPAAMKAPTYSKSRLTSLKSEHKPTVQKCSHFQGKTEMKVTLGKMVNVKKLTNSQLGMRIKESEKSIKSVHCVCKKNASGYKFTECRIHDVEATKPGGETRSVIPERGRRKCVEERKVVEKERSRSQEVKRIASEERSVNLFDNAERKLSEGKILFEKSTLYTDVRGRNWENGNVALDCQEKGSPVDSPTPTPRSPSKGCLIAAKENMIVMHNHGEDLKKSNSTANMVAITDDNSNNEDMIFRSYSSRPVEDYLSPESMERLRRDEELLSLDKRIWSNLEVEIREICEKTDILCDSGDDSGESKSDIIHQLFSNEDDEDLLDCLRTSGIRVESRKYAEYQDEWNVSSMGSKYEPELWEEKEKVKVEQRTKNSFERPKSRRAVEEISGRKIKQESKRTKSSEDSKIKNCKQGFRTKSLSGDIKWTNLIEDNYAKGSKERKTVNFLDDYKIGSKCVSSSFFQTHKNVGFIGKDVDEEYVSFEPGQVTLYQPHENHMLLYDIANCAATQGYLKMCGITYDVVIRKNAEQMSPSGRVPFISSSLCIIPEFEAIVSFMQYKKFACIPVEENDKPAFRAIISMIIDLLETAERYICWYDGTTLLNYTRPRIGGQYPFPLNHIMHWKKRHEERRRLTELGYSGRSLDLILGEISSCFRTLSRRLGNNHFFFGNVGTEVDALVYGHVYALFTTEVDGPLRDLQFIIQQYPNLVSFACNFDKIFCLDKFPSLELSYWDNIVTDDRYPSESCFSVKA